MKCKVMQDRLITVYTDQELNAKDDAEVEQHLAVCAECRAFFEAVQNKAVAPFKWAEEIQPDSVVWQRIQEKIEMERIRSEGGFWKLVDIFVSRLAIFARPLWGIPRPLPLMRAAFVTALILVAVVLARWPSSYADPAYRYISEQMAFMGELGSGNTDLMNGDLKDYNAAFEEIGA